MFERLINVLLTLLILMAISVMAVGIDLLFHGGCR